MSFEHLGLKPELLRAVAEKGYTTPSPIQAQAIPAVLSGRDLIAGAQTGTGKTAAFVLPTLQRLTQSSHTGRAPRALVLTPTRELAAQVAESARDYGKYVSVRTAVVFGGVSINPQIDAMRSGCDLLIATPGRLLDLAEQRAVDLRDIQVFVLDEADRMLDMGFIHAIRRVLKLLPAQRQNLMFSATYSEEIRELATRFLRDPATVEVAPRNATADRVEQTVYRVSKEHKRHLLAHLIDSGNWHQVLVFTRTKHGANRLAQQLEGSGIRSAAIHGNKSQGARVRALADFKDNRITALVATEVAARGLDIKELPHVVNYELPNVPEDYVHRIGRTARAGTTGSAVSLVSPDEAPLLRDIERLLRRSLAIAPLPEFPVTAPPPGARASDSERPSHHGGERRHSDGSGRHSGNRDGRRDRNGNRPQGGNRDGGHDVQRRHARGDGQGSGGHGGLRGQGNGPRHGGGRSQGHGQRHSGGNRDYSAEQRGGNRDYSADQRGGNRDYSADQRGGNRDHSQDQRFGNSDHSARPSEPNGNVAPRGQRDDQRQGQRHSHDHRGGHRDHSADQRGGNRAHGHGRPGGFGNGNSQGRGRPQRQRRTGSY